MPQGACPQSSTGVAELGCLGVEAYYICSILTGDPALERGQYGVYPRYTPLPSVDLWLLAGLMIGVMVFPWYT